MRSQNGQFQKIYDIDEKYFEKLDTHEKNYIFGLICADGCNYDKEGRVSISLIHTDKLILETVANKLRFTHPIKIINKENQTINGYKKIISQNYIFEMKYGSMKEIMDGLRYFGYKI